MHLSPTLSYVCTLILNLQIWSTNNTYTGTISGLGIGLLLSSDNQDSSAFFNSSSLTGGSFAGDWNNKGI